ncbi:type VI secretion system baseplate subunit TssE [Hydrocarboniclastica marina]|nr:type VI secretion system baseplate subunit TssE [Hydrocarboniclastica marina]
MRSDTGKGLQMSVLDRLLEQEAGKPAIALIRRSVLRDLEQLLNARRSWLPVSPKLRELKKSVLGYGLPDFTVMELSTQEGRQWLCQEIERTIVCFEPRLTRVRVSLRDSDTPLDRMLRLRIDAVLLLDPVPQPVAFDSELEPLSLSVSLQECA